MIVQLANIVLIPGAPHVLAVKTVLFHGSCFCYLWFGYFDIFFKLILPVVLLVVVILLKSSDVKSFLRGADLTKLIILLCFFVAQSPVIDNVYKSEER